jgi:predicted RNA-binding Zn-ribbon protein involved in translation (DUF1610 family)
MLSTRRKPFTIGGSKGVTLPQGMTIGEEVTMAGKENLLLMDTSGQIPDAKLLEFLIHYLEPAWQSWQEQEQQMAAQHKGFRPLQRGASAVAPAKPVEAEGVAQPQPEIPVASCFRCGQMIAWNLDPQATALCPQCGAILRLTATPKPNQKGGGHDHDQ